jgi:2'-5' RNA ligase
VSVRLFVAIEIDRAVREAAGRLIGELQRRVERLAPRARITWVAPDRMHVTVRFLGDVDDAHAGRIRAALEQPVPVAPFVLEIAGAGTFPETGEPRVVWAGLSHGREQLVAVEREVNARLRTVGVEPESRPYSPHLTLGRVRAAAGLRAPKLLAGLAGTALGTTHVAAITLFESRLSSEGPSYEVLLQTPFA